MTSTARLNIEKSPSLSSGNVYRIDNIIVTFQLLHAIPVNTKDKYLLSCNIH